MYAQRSSGDAAWVTAEEAALLPRRLRVAWAASVYERVLDLYSPYFRQSYFQQDALDLAWLYAAQGQEPGRRLDTLLETMKDRIADAEGEGYSQNAVFPGMLLLTDVSLNKPADSVAVIGNAAVMFAAHHLYRRGVSNFDPVVSQDHKMVLAKPVYALARTFYVDAIGEPIRSVRRGMFGAGGLEAPPKPGGMEAPTAAASSPPPHEVDFIKRNGWSQ